MAYQKPPNAQRDIRATRAAYQYRNMNRYVPTQIRAWSRAQGNPYRVADWRTAPAGYGNQAYFNNVLMQRLGGDLSLRDRMISMYYDPVQLPDAWKNVTPATSLEPWMQKRLQGDYTAMGERPSSMEGWSGEKTYTVARGWNNANVGKTYKTSYEAILAMLGLI